MRASLQHLASPAFKEFIKYEERRKILANFFCVIVFFNDEERLFSSKFSV
jgi:hypothetical protein